MKSHTNTGQNAARIAPALPEVPRRDELIGHSHPLLALIDKWVADGTAEADIRAWAGIEKTLRDEPVGFRITAGV